MKLEELQNYSMRGKTFTIVDKQNKKKTIEVGDEYPFTVEVVETEDTNLCSCYITILPDRIDTPYIYEIEEILESLSCVLVIVYQVNIGGNKWLEASTLEDLLEDITSTDCLFIPDEKMNR